MMAATVDETPQPRLRWWVVPLVAVIVLSIIGGVIALPTLLSHLPLPQFPTGSEQEPPATPAKLGHDFAPTLATYGLPEASEPVKPKEQPPVAVRVPKPPSEPPVTEQGIIDSINPWGKAGQPQTTATTGAPTGQVTGVQTSTPAQPAVSKSAKPVKKKREWEYLAVGTKEEPKKDSAGQGERPPGTDPNNLIHPARVSLPLEPFKTLYRSSILPGRLLDAINSDIPASTIRVLILMPIFGGTDAMPDRWKASVPVIDKGSIAILKQVGKATFGQARLPVKLEQIELPTGAVLDAKAMGGDREGAAGIPGTVDAHTGKLLLATGINAVLNLGLRTAAGTPGGGQYYQNPAQQAVQDVGQSVAQDVNSYTREVLKVPPTIKVDKNDPTQNVVTISLEENVQLNRKPVVVR